MKTSTTTIRRVVIVAVAAVSVTAALVILDIIKEEPAPQEIMVQRLVDKAIDLYDLDGEQAFSVINDMDSNLLRAGDLYVFVLDADNALVAHGVSPDLLRVDFDGVSDERGTNLGELFRSARNPDGAWVEYYWGHLTSPGSEPKLKMSWLKYHDGYTFGSGFHPP